MKYKILVILFLFCYIYPVFLFFSPIPTDRIIQVLGLLVIGLIPSFFLKFFKNRILINTLILCCFISIFIYIIQIWNYSSIDLYFFKEVISYFFYLFSAILITYVLSKIEKEDIFIRLLDYIVIIAVIQCIVSLVFFFYNPLFEFYSSLLSSDSNSNMISRLRLVEKRLIGIGSFFFSGVIKYGVAFLIAIVLPFFKSSIFSNKKYLYIISLVLLVIGGVMTGRTFFIALLLGLLLFLSLKLNNVWKLLFKVVPLALVIAILIYYLASNFIDMKKFDTIINFVFEIFINYQDKGTISTSSSNATYEMYKFPVNLKTWIIGDGRMSMPDGSYYMRSDVGLVRLIFYFGLLGLVLYTIYQILLFVSLIKLSNNKYLTKLYITLFVWMILLNSKGLANLDAYIMLFIVVGGYQKFVINKKKYNVN